MYEPHTCKCVNKKKKRNFYFKRKRGNKKNSFIHFFKSLVNVFSYNYIHRIQ